jgi:hypothetical protein
MSENPTNQALTASERELATGKAWRVTFPFDDSGSLPSKSFICRAIWCFAVGRAEGFSHYLFLALTACSTRTSPRSCDLAGLRRAVWTDVVEALLGGSWT